MTAGPESGHSQTRRILRNTAANGSVQLATMVSTFVLLPLLIRSFGPSQFGVMILAASLAGYAVLLDLGVGATLVRMVAERTALTDDAGVANAIFSAASIYASVGLLVALAMVALALLGGAIFSVNASELELLRTLLLIGAIQQLWYWPTVAARDALSGLQRYDLVSTVALGVVCADVAGSIYVIVTGAGPVTLVLIRFASLVVASLVNICLLWRLLPSAARRIHASMADARAILRSGSSVFVLQIAQVMSRQQTDKLVLGIFVGPAAVTLYEIASKLNSLVTTLASLAVSATLPVAAQLHAAERHETIRALFLRGTKLIATMASPLTAVLIAIAAPFIAVWMGPGYGGAVPVAQVLLLSQAFLPLYQLGDQIMIGKDRFSAWVPGGLTLAVLNVALSVLLVQSFGLIGVAVGTLVAVWLEFPWYARVFSRVIDLPIRTWLRSTAWPAYPLLALPATIAWIGGRSELGGSIVGLAIVAVAAATTYWAAMWLTGLQFQRAKRSVGGTSNASERA